MNADGRTPRSEPRNPLDAVRVRLDFPILNTAVNGRPLIYLDNAATTQKPLPVLEAIARFYTLECASVHRGAYFLSERATESYEGSRNRLSRFINAASPREIIFVRGATEGINLVAQTYGRAHVAPGDEILITGMEHHSNIVPWQMLCQEKAARLKVAPITFDGEVDIEQFSQLLGDKTRLAAITCVSNALGTINPVREMIQLAHSRNVPVLLDAAQAVSHLPIDVRHLDCDFLVFSGHKMYGPTGIGILYGKETLLDAMPPYQGGGDMVRSVTLDTALYEDLPHKFEAGTPNISGAIGLGAAVDYISALGLQGIAAHEQSLTDYAIQSLKSLEALRLIGNAKKRAAVISFVLEGLHPHDISTILNSEGVAVRAGHHCAQPVMDFYRISGSVRASFALYNTIEDIDALLAGLRKAGRVFR